MTSLLGADTLRIIRVLETEHHAMTAPTIDSEQTRDRVRGLAAADMPALLATADQACQNRAPSLGPICRGSGPFPSTC